MPGEDSDAEIWHNSGWFRRSLLMDTLQIIGQGRFETAAELKLVAIDGARWSSPFCANAPLQRTRQVLLHPLRSVVKLLPQAHGLPPVSNGAQQ